MKKKKKCKQFFFFFSLVGEKTFTDQYFKVWHHSKHTRYQSHIMKSYSRLHIQLFSMTFPLFKYLRQALGRPKGRWHVSIFSGRLLYNERQSVFRMEVISRRQINRNLLTGHYGTKVSNYWLDVPLPLEQPIRIPSCSAPQIWQMNKSPFFFYLTFWGEGGFAV